MEQTELLTRNQVAKLLNCSSRHVWDLYQAKSIPAPIRIGIRALRWKKDEILNWINERQMKS